MAKIGIIKGTLYKNTVADRCPHCGKMAEVELHIQQSSLIVGLPLAPTGRSTQITCTECNKAIDTAAAPPYVATRYNQQISTIKTPVWSYSGSLIVGVLLLVFAVYLPFHNSSMKEYIQAPKVGDVYEIKYEDNSSLINKTRYSLMKVEAVSKDEITFLRAIYESNSKGLSKIKSKPDDELWGDEELTYSKAALEKMLEIDSELHISDIERNGK